MRLLRTMKPTIARCHSHSRDRLGHGNTTIDVCAPSFVKLPRRDIGIPSWPIDARAPRARSSQHRFLSRVVYDSSRNSRRDVTYFRFGAWVKSYSTWALPRIWTAMSLATPRPATPLVVVVGMSISTEAASLLVKVFFWLGEGGEKCVMHPSARARCVGLRIGSRSSYPLDNLPI